MAATVTGNTLVSAPPALPMKPPANNFVETNSGFGPPGCHGRQV